MRVRLERGDVGGWSRSEVVVQAVVIVGGRLDRGEERASRNEWMAGSPAVSNAEGPIRIRSSQ